MTRRIVLVSLIVLLSAQPLAAQEGGGRLPRKWLVAGIGALITGAIATVYALNFERNIGGCSAVECVVPVTVGAGALIGFMIGSEMDRLYGLRYAHAPPLSVRGVELPLSVLPNDLDVDASTVFVSGQQAVELVEAGPRLRPLGLRARGLRGIGAVAADSAANRLYVGTGVGLYRFPIVGDEPGVLAHPGEISALSTTGRLGALGLGPDFQIVHVEDSIVPLGDPVPEVSRVVGLAWERTDLLWVLTEDRLASYRISATGDAVELGEFPLPAIGRRLHLADRIAYVAAGSGGVYAVDIGNPEVPTEISNWSGARFAYDVAAAGGAVYVAAGPEGLYVIQLDPEPRFIPLGLARDVGFVAAVETDGGSVYLLDRTGGTLRRVPAGETR